MMIPPSRPELLSPIGSGRVRSFGRAIRAASAPLLLGFLVASAADLHAARLSVGTVTGSAGSGVTLALNYASEGASVSILQVDILASAPLSITGATAGAAATAAGKQVTVTSISGGTRLLVYGLNQTVLGDGSIANLAITIAAGATSGAKAVSAANASAADANGNSVSISTADGSVTVGAGGGPIVATFILPSTARAQGAGGAFYTTDVTIGNTGTTDGSVTLKFLGNNGDGRSGLESTFSLPAGRSTTFTDVLGSVFGVTSGFGAIQVKSTVTTLNVLGQTSTPGGGGTFGQSVPAAGSSQLVVNGTPRSIVAIREDGSFRTNLILANSTEASLDVDVALISASGGSLGSKRYTLFPLGMTQVTKVVRDLGVSSDVSGARVILTAVTPGGSFATYASVIDNVTNDPRTLTPQ